MRTLAEETRIMPPPPARVSIFYRKQLSLFLTGLLLSPCIHMPPFLSPTPLVAFHSQSPSQARAPLSGDRSTTTPHGDPLANTTPSAISGAGGGTGAVSIADAPGRHRIGARGATRSNRNDDTDADSVVFGSPKGVRDDDPREQSVARVPARSRGEFGAVSETSRGRERGNDGGTPPQAQGGGDNDLYFDPVLNCYYDRVADKYYGLR